MMNGKIMGKIMRGFTLIELMIVVAIVAILAAVAYPSYLDSLTKGRRSDAQGVLMEFAGAMERHYTNNSSYLGAVAGGATSGDPIIFSIRSPISGPTIYYNLIVQASNASSYTLRATPVNAQAGDGYLEILSTGVKQWDRNNGGTIGAGEACWSKSC